MREGEREGQGEGEGEGLRVEGWLVGERMMGRSVVCEECREWREW